MADNEEAGCSLEKADMHKVYWLDCNLLAENLLLLVLSPKKVIAIKGRPCKIVILRLTRRVSWKQWKPREGRDRQEDYINND